MPNVTKLLLQSLPLLWSCHAARSGEVVADAGSQAGAVDASAPAPVLPAGTCGVLKRITVMAPFDPIIRAPHGFITPPTGDTGGDLTWSVFSEDGVRQSSRSAQTSRSYALTLLPMGGDPFTGHITGVYWGDEMPPAATAPVLSEVTGSGVTHALGTAFKRGTTAHAAAVAFDGLRAVYATGHVATDPAHAYLMDETGTPLGAATALSPASAFDCLDAVATEHAGAWSMVDRSAQPPLWRIIELAADGSRLREAQMDASKLQGCPRVSRAPGGFDLSMTTADSLELYKLGASGDLQRYAVMALDATMVPLWFGELQGRSLLLLRDDMGRARMLLVAADGALTQLPGELPLVSESVAAEAGRLFVRSRLSAEPAAPAEILELGCAHPR